MENNTLWVTQHVRTHTNNTTLYVRDVLQIKCCKMPSKYRIDHSFEINIRGEAENIYREICGLSDLDHAKTVK